MLKWINGKAALYSIIFGLVVDRNRVDFIIESGWLHYSLPEGASVEGQRRTFFSVHNFVWSTIQLRERRNRIITNTKSELKGSACEYQEGI